ncbi:hypothetical protein, partial [Alistipes ihumii]
LINSTVNKVIAFRELPIEDMIRHEHGLPLREFYQRGIEDSRFIIQGTTRSKFFNNYDYEKSY